MFGRKKANNIPDVYCVVCQKNLGVTGYDPKAEWNLNGKLCSKCYGKFLGQYGNKQQQVSTDKLTVKETNTKQKSCPKCNSVISEESVFCNKCGARIQFVCTKCGNVNPDGSAFCNKCGSSL